MVYWVAGPDENLSGADIDEQIQISETQVAYHSERALSLKRQRNERTSFWKLTDDILLRIFALLSHDPARIVDRWDWVGLAHICHRWRVIALENAELWSTIIVRVDSLSRGRLQCFLELSKDLELSLTILQNNGQDAVAPLRLVEMAISMVNHNRKFKELRAEVPADTWKTLSSLFDLTLSTLRTLDLRLKKGHSRLEKLFLKGSFRKAHFGNLLLDPTSLCNVPQMNNLLDLTFDYVIFTSSQLPDLLRNCPKLENLHLLGCRTDNPEWPNDKVHLACLNCLSFRTMEVTDIFNHIEYMDLPLFTNLTIECNPDKDFTATVTALNLGNIFKEQCYYTSLDIALFSNEIHFGAVLMPVEGVDSMDVGSGKTSILVLWKGEEHATSIIGKAKEILSQNCLKNASKIKIQIDMDEGKTISEGLWTLLLEPLDKALSLEQDFIGNDSKTKEELFKALRVTASDELDSKRFVFCPALKDISFRYAHYSVEAILELGHSLRLRKAYCAPIRNIWMYDVIGVTKEDRSQIEDLYKPVQYFELCSIDSSKYFELASKKVGRVLRRRIL